MVASSTLLICAQRLTRKLCESCKEAITVPVERLLSLGLTEEDLAGAEVNLFKPVGCPKCSNGFRGRFALLETMRMNDSVRRMIVERAQIMEIKKQAVSEGMLTLRRCGLLNALRGKTALEEVVRVTMAD
jgi:type IV pilus assembly protein PilB